MSIVVSTNHIGLEELRDTIAANFEKWFNELPPTKHVAIAAPAAPARLMGAVAPTAAMIMADEVHLRLMALHLGTLFNVEGISLHSTHSVFNWNKRRFCQELNELLGQFSLHYSFSTRGNRFLRIRFTGGSDEMNDLIIDNLRRFEDIEVTPLVQAGYVDITII